MEDVVKLKVNKSWRPYIEDEVAVLRRARELFQACIQAVGAVAEFPGWMFWKRYPNGREYLVRAYDRKGRGTTLGSRSDVTESEYLQFKNRQTEAKMQLKM